MEVHPGTVCMHLRVALFSLHRHKHFFTLGRSLLQLVQAKAIKVLKEIKCQKNTQKMLFAKNHWTYHVL